MKLKKFEELNESVAKDKRIRYFSSFGEAEKLGEQICDFIDRKGFVFNNDDNFDFYTELNKLLYKHILKKHTITSISNEPHEDYHEVHYKSFKKK
jgi:hypothetical protein